MKNDARDFLLLCVHRNLTVLCASESKFVLPVHILFVLVIKVGKFLAQVNWQSLAG